MADFITLSKRLTRKYVGTWRHLDRWVDICKAKMLAGRKVKDGNGYEYGSTWRYTVIAPKAVDPKVFRRALEDEFSAWGCSHDYDCCGCASTSATATRIKGRQWRLEIETAYNY